MLVHFAFWHMQKFAVVLLLGLFFYLKKKKKKVFVLASVTYCHLPPIIILK